MASPEKLTVQIDATTLQSLREIASREGRGLGALVREALEDLVAKPQGGKPRTSVMAAYHASHETFAPLYPKLAD
ncbi:ribbon-helix-helix protein, CopG family [Pleomorphomonas sp. JP5]|uniref:ribbon-helix-helix protein, CopG family n=1 Tax=Pleomorphomonas sp. JP5 TaxID=2942998 RepID=UPI002044572D|nr:ribbon-helix-helix protein, CopG family [Pleomorphomonas sp. JP5]MCM5557140.1 ribbon-helix-helix domain-containing protein [Pleomorphomonas sp. JP5]